MKRFLIAVALATAAPLGSAADVGISVSIGQPGFYGHIDIGDYPRPEVIYGEPIVVERVRMDRPPIYLHVPPGHAKHWDKHCHEYNACGERVYFVRSDWYEREYIPRYQERHAGRDHDRDERKHDDRGKHNDGEHDKGKDHGHGN